MSTTIETAIRKNSDITFRGWEKVYDIPARLAASTNVREGLQCPQCAQATVVCCYVDLGHSLDYLDQFCHVCLNPNCRYAEEFNEHRQTAQERSDDGFCPFCKRNVFKPERALS